MAIIETFAQAGIAIPSGQAEIGIRRMDWLREMIAEGASLPPGKGAGNGTGTSAETAALHVSMPAK